MCTPHNPKYKEVKEIFDEAESHIKKIELLNKNLRIPAVNQLRYVAHHLTKAITCNDPKVEDAELNEALEHARRGRYDALEAGIHYFVGVFTAFQNDFKDEVIVDLFADYPKYIRRINEIIRMIGGIKRRADNHNWPNVVNEFEELHKMYSDFIIMRTELNKRKKKEKTIFIFTALGLIVAIIGVIVAILVG